MKSFFMNNMISKKKKNNITYTSGYVQNLSAINSINTSDNKKIRNLYDIEEGIQFGVTENRDRIGTRGNHSGAGSEPSDSSISPYDDNLKDDCSVSNDSPGKYEMFHNNSQALGDTNYINRSHSNNQTTQYDNSSIAKNSSICQVLPQVIRGIFEAEEKEIIPNKVQKPEDIFKFKKLSYNDVKMQVNKYYEHDIIHKYSSALDILASYLKGQKILYMESRTYTVGNLNRLMFPAIFITAVCSVAQSSIQCNQYGSIILAGLSAFVSFLLAIINYLKLDAASEAHKISAHQYDKLQSFVEFQSGQILLFSDPQLGKSTIMSDVSSNQHLCPLRRKAELSLIDEMKKKLIM